MSFCLKTCHLPRFNSFRYLEIIIFIQTGPLNFLKVQRIVFQTFCFSKQFQKIKVFFRFISISFSAILEVINKSECFFPEFFPECSLKPKNTLCFFLQLFLFIFFSKDNQREISQRKHYFYSLVS